MYSRALPGVTDIGRTAAALEPQLGVGQPVRVVDEFDAGGVGDRVTATAALRGLRPVAKAFDGHRRSLVLRPGGRPGERWEPWLGTTVRRSGRAPPVVGQGAFTRGTPAAPFGQTDGQQRLP